MLKSIYRALFRRNVSVAIRVFNPTHNNIKLCSCVQLQPHHFSSTSAQKPISEIANKDSFTVNYLINTFGFSPERALTTASKYLKVGSTEEKLDLLLSFLINQGFTEEQIRRIARRFPQIVASNPGKTLLPKIEYFRSRGLPDADIAKIFVMAPMIFGRSLDKQIKPSLECINNLFDTSYVIKLCCSQKPTSKSVNQDSFTVNYLINTFGFSQDKALSTVTRYLKVGSTEKPDLVLSFLMNQGFTEEQIKCLVRKFPRVIVSDTENTLLPKIEFFRSRGISDAEVTKIFLAAPVLLSSSLNKQILPSFNYLKSLFDSSGTTLGSLSRFARILLCSVESRLHPNIEILRDAGVPNPNIIHLLRLHPRVLMVDTERFRKVVEQAKKMKFKTNQKVFILAIQAFRTMSKPTWDKKVAVYKKWGLSENDIFSVFQRNPYCMMASEDKITAVMDFVVNKMGFDSSLVLKITALIVLSLQKRVKPRFVVYEKLSENGWIERGSLLVSLFNVSERIFLERFVQSYEKEVPELLQLYQKELAAAKS